MTVTATIAEHTLTLTAAAALGRDSALDWLADTLQDLRQSCGPPRRGTQLQEMSKAIRAALTPAYTDAVCILAVTLGGIASEDTSVYLLAWTATLERELTECDRQHRLWRNDVATDFAARVGVRR